MNSKERKIMVLVDVSDMFHRNYHIRNDKRTVDGGEVDCGAVLGYLDYYYNALKKDLALDNVHDIIHILDPIDTKSIYRCGLDPEYKANRESDLELNKQKVLLRYALNQLREKYIDVDGIEADDLIGTLVKYYNSLGFYVVIVGRDKDLKQLIKDGDITMYSYVKNENGFNEHRLIGEQDVKESYGILPSQMIEYLAILGDTSDNIRGLKIIENGKKRGLGSKSTAELLTQFGNINAIYDNIDYLKPKYQELFKKGKQELLLSKKLTTIQCYERAVLEKAIYLDYVLSYGLNIVIRDTDPQFADKPFVMRDTHYNLAEIKEKMNNVMAYYSELETNYHTAFYQEIRTQIKEKIDKQTNGDIITQYRFIVPNYPQKNVRDLCQDYLSAKNKH